MQISSISLVLGHCLWSWTAQKTWFPKFTYLHISMHLNKYLTANCLRGRGMAFGPSCLVFALSHISLSLLKFLSPRRQTELMTGPDRRLLLSAAKSRCHKSADDKSRWSFRGSWFCLALKYCRIAATEQIQLIQNNQQIKMALIRNDFLQQVTRINESLDSDVANRQSSSLQEELIKYTLIDN